MEAPPDPLPKNCTPSAGTIAMTRYAWKTTLTIVVTKAEFAKSYIDHARISFREAVDMRRL